MKWLYVILFCMICASLSASTWHCDPVSGSTENDGTSEETAWTTLEWALTNKLGTSILAGDTVLCYPGYHGEVSLSAKRNASYITCQSTTENGAKLSNIDANDCAYWKFIDFWVCTEHSGSWSETALCKFLDDGDDDSHHLWVEGCLIQAVLDATAATYLTEQEWSDGIANCHGILFSGEGGYNTALNNTLRYVDQGIQTRSNDLIDGNVIEYFEEDGVDVDGPNDITIRDNIIRNPIHLTGEHQDGIQTGSETRNYSGITIEGNQILQSHNHAHPAFSSSIQGMFFKLEEGYTNTNWVVRNNIVNVESSWGINVHYAIDCVIANNIVIPPTGIEGTPSIGYRYSASNCRTRNNIASQWSTGDGITASNNLDWDDYSSDPDSLFADYDDENFLPISGCDSIDAGTLTDAPLYDIREKRRDGSPDIGPYEYTQGYVLIGG